MRVPDNVRDCVFFIGRIIDKGGSQERKLIGTAFAVGVPLVTSDQTCYYLVTVRHIADSLLPGQWFIRYNTLDGTCEEMIVEKNDWRKHPDPQQAESVDAAVMPLILPEPARFTNIPGWMFATDVMIKRRQIGAGDEVFIVGLFTKM